MAARCAWSTVLACALIAVAMAQDVSGRWSGEQKGPRLPVIVFLDLKVDGAKVTGTMSSDAQGSSPIVDGKIDGRKISFKTTHMFANNKIDSNWNGELKADTLTVTREMFQNGRRFGEFPITLTRKKD